MCGYYPVLQILLLLLLCLKYVFSADHGEHGGIECASQPLQVMCFRIQAEIRINLLHKLYVYRLGGSFVPAYCFEYYVYLYALLRVFSAVSLLHQHSRRHIVLSSTIDRTLSNS